MALAQNGNGNGSKFSYNWDPKGWGKLVIELAIILIGMAFWFSRLEGKVERTHEWMIHHVEAEHKERAVMHHRRFEDTTCMECKMGQPESSKIPDFIRK